MNKKKSPLRFTLLFFCIILASWWSFSSLNPPESSSSSNLEAWVLDVGQGESVLLKDPSGKTLLFDGGPDDSVLNQLGEVLPPFDRTIDLAILSHNHSDHIRGLISVLERYDVKEVWISGAIHTTNDYQHFLEAIKDNHTPTKVVFFDKTACKAICPKPTPFGNLLLQVYHPMENMTGQRPNDQHDATVSVKVSYGQESLFLTGDLNEGHETDMMKACQPPTCSLAATILQVPHHGSDTGLSEAFLEAVHPSSAVIPVGLHNKFKHPRQIILDRLTTAQIPIYRTDLQSRIHMSIGQDAYSITTEK